VNTPLRSLAALIALTAFLAACAGANPRPITTPPMTTTASSPGVSLLPDEPPPHGATLDYTTDFSRHSVPYRDIISLGIPRDGIAPIGNPRFIAVSEGNEWLADQEAVVFVEVGSDERAYPVQILTWHEIVNDMVGGVPLVITYCPLCNSAIAFERSVAGQILEFGNTCRLYYSNLILYDRQSQSWWQQASGEAIAGKLTGTRLIFRPAPIISWAEFKAAYPDGKVLSRDTGYERTYGRNPYVGYDDVTNPPQYYAGPETPDAMAPVARVLGIDLGSQSVAYPYDLLQRVRVVNDRVGGTDVVVMWAPGTASALDALSVSTGREVGAANAFARALGGRTLTFALEGSRVLDLETRSEWDLLGRAVSGKLVGEKLTPIVAVNHFWFSWSAFRPGTRIFHP